MKTDHKEGADTSLKTSEINALTSRIKEILGNDSVSSFARQSGIGESLIRKYLDGAQPGALNLAAMARAKGVSIDWLVTGTPPKERLTKVLEEIEIAKDLEIKKAVERMTSRNSIAQSLAAAGLLSSDNEYSKAVSTALTTEEPTEDYRPATRAVPAGYVKIPSFSNVRASAGEGVINGDVLQADESMVFREDWIRYELGARPQDLWLIRVRGDSMEPTLRSGDVVLVDSRATSPNHDGIYILRMGDSVLVKRLQVMPGRKIRVTSDNPAFSPWIIDPADESNNEFSVVGRVVWWGRRA